MAKFASRWRNHRRDLAHTEDLLRWSAQCNIAHHEGLYSALVAAIDRSSLSRDEIAQRLGLTREGFDDAISGQTDLTLTELRMLSSASEVVVDFRVESAAVERERMNRRALEQVNEFLFVVHELTPREDAWREETSGWVEATHARVAHA